MRRLKGLRVFLALPDHDILLALKELLEENGAEVLNPLEPPQHEEGIVTIWLDCPLTRREVEVLQAVADSPL